MIGGIDIVKMCFDFVKSVGTFGQAAASWLNTDWVVGGIDLGSPIVFIGVGLLTAVVATLILKVVFH